MNVLDIVVINANGLFLAGKPAESAWRETFTSMPDTLEQIIQKTKIDFDKIKILIPDIQQLQFTESKSYGIRFQPGRPVPGYGYVWCRAKCNGEEFGPWIFCGKVAHRNKSANYMKYLIYSPVFRAAVVPNKRLKTTNNADTSVKTMQDDKKIFQKSTPEHKSLISQQMTSHELNIARIADSLDKITVLAQRYLDLQR